MLEMGLLTLFTTLPAAVVTWLVVTVLNGLPSLATGLVLPFYFVLLLIAAVGVLHLLICILPVRSVLRQPPAALAGKDG